MISTESDDNMRITPFQAIYPRLNFITSTDSFFDSVKEEYNHHLANGFFLRTDEEGVYLYEIVGRERNYIGLIANIDLEDYAEGKIKKHEQTMTEKEQLQIQLLLRRKAIVKPVLLCYPQVDAIKHWLLEQKQKSEPFLEAFFERNQETHRIWQVTNETAVKNIRKLFANQVAKAYVADGHHRIAAAAILRRNMADQPGGQRYGRLLCALFGSDQLEILDYNRVVDGLHDLSPTKFMALLSRYFNIKPLTGPAPPRRKHELTMFLQKEWYRLRWRKRVLKKHKHREVLLDTMLLNEHILGEILGMEDVRKDTHVEYVIGPLGLEGLRKKTLQSPYNVGFALHPIYLKDMMQLVDFGQVLPPKSTWFEPRMKNGLIVYPFSKET